MNKESMLKIGLDINAIATLLDDENLKKVKPYLEDIEKIVLEEGEKKHELH